MQQLQSLLRQQLYVKSHVLLHDPDRSTSLPQNIIKAQQVFTVKHTSGEVA